MPNHNVKLLAVVAAMGVLVYLGLFHTDKHGRNKLHLGTCTNKDASALSLAKKLRILCIILTTQSNIAKRAVHVRNTWAHRCNKYIFMSSTSNQTFPTIDVKVPNGRRYLPLKTFKSFKYVYEKHFSDADWFLKADDDTFVIVENLRYFLSNQNKDEPIFFGHHFKKRRKPGYFSGGGGYVVSKEALRRFGKREVGTDVCKNIHRQKSGEDFHFGKCMAEIGVKLGKSTDTQGRSRFHCFSPTKHLQGNYPDWYYDFDAFGAKMGRNNMSDYAISFHYVSPEHMYTMEYFLYHLRPYGFTPKHLELNR